MLEEQWEGEFPPFPHHSELIPLSFDPRAFQPSLWSCTAVGFFVRTETHRGQGDPAHIPCVPSKTLITATMYQPGAGSEVTLRTSLTLAKISL